MDEAGHERHGADEEQEEKPVDDGAYDASGHASPKWWALALYPARSVGAWLATAALFAVALKVSATKRRGISS
ncbi:hypothetical protein ACH4M4_11900 [Streptomyces sp. NPDC017254]|uniref:hypothetical protein n=1 Tax=unclassified Streptomyces TaxID=2593676 RepID=UPI0037A51604